jgi:sugar/nucleoside kinase (ribokinase family)
LQRFGIERFCTLVAGVDLLLPNLDEARLLSGGRDARAAAMSLLEIASTVVVTAGAAGAVSASRDDGSVKKLSVVPAAAMDTGVVDTTGAGDAFAAGYLAALLDGDDPAARLARGARAAARAVGAMGAQPPRPG